MQKKYPNGEPKFESVGSWMWNMPFINEKGWEDSDIGFECKGKHLWFYETQGLKDGIDWREMKVLGEILLEMSDWCKELEEKREEAK